MTNFILEEQKLVFARDIKIVEEVFADRVLCHDKNHHLFVIKKVNVLNNDFTCYFN